MQAPMPWRYEICFSEFGAFWNAETPDDVSAAATRLPLSPSGPAQAIALVQHTPGVLVEQDLSDIFKKSRTALYSGPKPMLQSAYPK